jgi:hypothetical protein
VERAYQKKKERYEMHEKILKIQNILIQKGIEYVSWQSQGTYNLQHNIALSKTVKN